MRRGFFVSTTLATGILVGGSTFSAHALPAASSLGHGAQPVPVVQEAGWQCGPRRCVWVRNFWGPVPGFAMGWGPPLRPDCYWKQNFRGKWKHKCD